MNGYSPPVTIRRAIPAERKVLEALQLRASLGNEGDREALLRHPDTIDMPVEQIRAGGVFVLEQDGRIVRVSAILPPADGDTDIDPLVLPPGAPRRGRGAAPSLGLLSPAANIAGGTYPSDECGRRWLYSFFHAAAIALASRTAANRSAFKSSSRSRTWKLPA